MHPLHTDLYSRTTAVTKVASQHIRYVHLSMPAYITEVFSTPPRRFFPNKYLLIKFHIYLHFLHTPLHFIIFIFCNLVNTSARQQTYSANCLLAFHLPLDYINSRYFLLITQTSFCHHPQHRRCNSLTPFAVQTRSISFELHL